MSHLAKAWSEMRGYPAAVFFVCLLGWCLTNMDQSLFGYAIPGITIEFGVGMDAIGWVLAVSFVFTAFAAVIIGLLTDQYGRRIMFLEAEWVQDQVDRMYRYCGRKFVIIQIYTAYMPI